jgi:hypothetical protein
VGWLCSSNVHCLRRRFLLPNPLQSTDLCVWFLLSARLVCPNRMPRRQLLPVPFVASRVSRGALERSGRDHLHFLLARHVRRAEQPNLLGCRLRHLSCRFLLYRWGGADAMQSRTLRQQRWASERHSMHAVCGRQIRIRSRYDERRRGLHELSSGHLWRDHGPVLRCQLHELSCGAAGTGGRSVHCGGGMPIVYRRILLPRWECTGWMRRRCFLPGRHVDCQSALSTGVLLHVDEYDCGLSLGTLWRSHTADGGHAMHGVWCGQIRSSGRCDDGSCRLYQLPAGYVGQCACTGCSQLVHQLCGRHCRPLCWSVHCGGRLSVLSRFILLPGRNEPSDLYRRRLLPVRHEHSEPELSCWLLLYIAVEQSRLPCGSVQLQ